MYVVTFYSFKGGVGRTQALVNVGYELAKTGRKVLLVDFDLEAPGLDTFMMPGQPLEAKGIIDFVTEYTTLGTAPAIDDYVQKIVLEPPAAHDRGSLWVMPSGRRDSTYAYRLGRLDWQDLYDRHDGYLLFEDLKLQWQTRIGIDYVLIDSRTGYTEVAGICTRQLADAVVVMFMPTEQHLIGLPKIVSDIRGEKDSSRGKDIQLHFVMSNVPDLDDEEDVLQRQVDLFKSALQFDELTAVVRRYESLALLSQTVFTKDRPKTRLARDYQRLATLITERNVEDRAGAVSYLARLTQAGNIASSHFSRRKVERKVDAILHAHPADADILVRVAGLRLREARLEDALAVLDRAIDADPASTAALLRRAECRHLTGDATGAVEDLKALLRSTSLTDHEMARVIRLIREHDRSALLSLGNSSAVLSLPPESQIWIASRLNFNRESLLAAKQIYERLFDTTSVEEPVHVRHQLSMVLIGLGEFEAARALLEQLPVQDEVACAFNYAMADWGVKRHPTPELFREVIRLAAVTRFGGANFEQCLALTHAVLGEKVDATMRVRKARREIDDSPTPTFTCWRYVETSAREFATDLDALEQFILEPRLSPPVIAASATERFAGM